MDLTPSPAPPAGLISFASLQVTWNASAGILLLCKPLLRQKMSLALSTAAIYQRRACLAAESHGTTHDWAEDPRIRLSPSFLLVLNTHSASYSTFSSMLLLRLLVCQVALGGDILLHPCKMPPPPPEAMGLKRHLAGVPQLGSNNEGPVLSSHQLCFQLWWDTDKALSR